MQLKHSRSPFRGNGATPADVMWPRIGVAVSVAFLTAIGVLMVYSASSMENVAAGLDPWSNGLKQLAFAIVGAALCVLVACKVPYSLWRGKATWVAFIVSFLGLVAVMAVGTEALGAKRWIVVNGLSIQPSEFAKIGLMLAAAKLVADYQEGAMAPGLFLCLFAGIVVAIVGMVCVAESDLGTTIVCFVGLVVLLYLSEVPKRYVAGFVSIAAALGALALVAAPYRLARVMAHFNPEDAEDGNYQVSHAMDAFANGGLLGQGLGNSVQKYQYLPEASNDFIFAIIGEEMGFVGTVLVIGLFVALLASALRMAQLAPDRFGAVLCGSFGAIIVAQAFLNIGCSIGILPVTGKTLPFMSGGGSSLVASYIMVGLMLSVSMASGESPVYSQRRAGIQPLPRSQEHGAPRGRAGYASGRGRAAGSAGYAGYNAGTGRAGRAAGADRAASSGYAFHGGYAGSGGYGGYGGRAGTGRAGAPSRGYAGYGSRGAQLQLAGASTRNTRRGGR